jgi:hypothetical protein
MPIVGEANGAALFLDEYLPEWYVEADGETAGAYQVDPRGRAFSSGDEGGFVTVEPMRGGWHVYAFDWNDRRGAYDTVESEHYPGLDAAARAAGYFAQTVAAPGSRLSRSQYEDMAGGRHDPEFAFGGWM